MLLLGLHVGGGTRVGGHVHWNNQKYLKVVKTSTNVLHHFALEPLYDILGLVDESQNIVLPWSYESFLV